MKDPDAPVMAGPAPPTPPRPRWSIRRTVSIDTHWPEGRDGPMVMDGRARDLLTRDDPDAPVVLAKEGFRATLTGDRRVVAITSSPPRYGIGALVGVAAGKQMRAAIDQALPDERGEGTPLYLLLDDIAGSSLVAAWGWSMWSHDWAERVLSGPAAASRRARMEGVCTGFRRGSSAFDMHIQKARQNIQLVASLDGDTDPFSWHEMPRWQGILASRRARRIDVYLDEQIVIDAHFQDSATTPAGERAAVHEYLLNARADRQDGLLRTITADPRILPFEECPSAALNLNRLLGTPLPNLRGIVLERLAKTDGCTHLNDMVRALAEVPRLAAALEAETHPPA